MDILLLIGGLLLILVGANCLTDGAASVAKRFHIPSIVIGLTIVAFGTSEGKARFSGFCAAQVWARDDTKLVVEVEDNAFVCIDITSRTKVEITASGTAKVTVFQHGGECINRASGNANIKVIDKR